MKYKFFIGLKESLMSKITVSLAVLFGALCSMASPMNLEEFEALSLIVKNKQNMNLQDDGNLKIVLQFSQPQRKIQPNSEASESALSAE